MFGTHEDSVNGLVEHLFRHYSGQIVASLTHQLGAQNLWLAEEVSQEALLRAIQGWPLRGVPENPGGWLLNTARNLAIDRLRRDQAWNHLGREIADESRFIASERENDFKDRQAAALDDDFLAMLFFCNHPALGELGRVALTLKVLCGFSLKEISRAFLVPEKTAAQRVARAKKRLRQIEETVRVPAGPELTERRDAVLTTLYLIFTEGYSPHDGALVVREELCFEAIRLLQLLVGHAAGNTPAAHALLALMWFQGSRLGARTSGDGMIVLLPDQDRNTWDREMISAGMKELQQAESGNELSTYHLQAGIAACHASAATYEETDWASVVLLYDHLIELDPSPLFRLNRAIAISMLHGPDAGLLAASEPMSDPALRDYPYLAAALAECYMRQGDTTRARELFTHAMAAAFTEPERKCMATRAQGSAFMSIP